MDWWYQLERDRLQAELRDLAEASKAARATLWGNQEKVNRVDDALRKIEMKYGTSKP